MNHKPHRCKVIPPADKNELTGLPLGTIRDWVRKGKLLVTTLDEETRKIFINIDHFNTSLDQRIKEQVILDEDES